MPAITKLGCNTNLVGGHLDSLKAKVELGSLYSTYCGPNNETVCKVGDFSGKFEYLRTGTSNYVDDSVQPK